MTDLVSELRARACPAGKPWTGDDPKSDHGHTDCWLHHQAADEIERLRVNDDLTQLVQDQAETIRRLGAICRAQSELLEEMGREQADLLAAFNELVGFLTSSRRLGSA